VDIHFQHACLGTDRNKMLAKGQEETCTARWNQAACIEHKKEHGMCVLLLELRRSKTNSPAPWGRPPCSSWPPQMPQPPIAKGTRGFRSGTSALKSGREEQERQQPGNISHPSLCENSGQIETRGGSTFSLVSSLERERAYGLQ
jgi:hypothetical protein